MAFSFRTPQQMLLSTLAKDDVKLVQDTITKRLVKTEEEASCSFAYYLPEDQLQFLTSRGIYTSVNAYVPHSHPACKTIENHILYRVLPEALNGRPSVVISIKEKKIQKFNRITGTKNKKYNRLVTGKDQCRYISEGDQLDRTFIKWDKLPLSEDIFLFDEVHYWNLKTFKNFARNLFEKGFKRIFFTIVQPPEILEGYESSLCPEIYEFKKTETGRFSFYPDGNVQEAYNQPISEWPFRFSSLNISGQARPITRVYSLCAHHLFMVSSENLLEETWLEFGDFSCIPVSDKLKTKPEKPLRARINLLKKIVSYMMCLKKPDIQSAFAKLRTMTDGCIAGEMRIVNAFFNTLKKEGCYNDFEELELRNQPRVKLPKEIHHTIEKFEEMIKVQPIRICRTSENDERQVNLINMDNLNFDQFMFGRNAEDMTLLMEIENKNSSFELDRIDLRVMIEKRSPTIQIRTPKLSDLMIHELNKNLIFNVHGYMHKPKLISDGSGRDKVKSLIDEISISKKFSSKLIKHSNFIRPGEKKEIIERMRREKENKLKAVAGEEEKHVKDTLISETGKRKEKGILTTILPIATPLEKRESESKGLNSPTLTYEKEFEERIKDPKNSDGASSSGSSLMEMDFSMLDEIEKENESNVAVDPLYEAILENMEKGKTCVVDCFSEIMGVERAIVISLILAKDKGLGAMLANENGIGLEGIKSMAHLLNVYCMILTEEGTHDCTQEMSRFEEIFYKDNHLSRVRPTNFIQSKRLKVLEDNCLFEYSEEDALKLNKSLMKGYTGVISENLDLSVYIKKIENFKFHGVFGLPGSGKSRNIINLMATSLNSPATTFVSPRVNLLRDVENKVRSMCHSCRVIFKTFESALKCKRKVDTLIIDEFTLFPPGYIEIIVSKYKPGKVVMIGDPCQASYHNESDFRYIGDSNVVSKIIPKDVYYFRYSHRLSSDLSSSLGFKCYSPIKVHKDNFKIFDDLKLILPALSHKSDAVLVSSFEIKKELSKYFSRVMTFGESQGLTFDHVAVSIDLNTQKVSDEAIFVALTRARKGTFFFYHSGTDASFVTHRLKGKLIQKILVEKRIEEKDVDWLLGTFGKDKNVHMITEDKLAGDIEKFEDRLSGDPYLKALCPLIELANDPFEEPINEPIRHDSPPKIHLALTDFDIARDERYEKMVAREKREFIGSGLWSEQFNDLDRSRFSGDNLVYNAASVFPRHKGSDTLTFVAAVKKRLRFSNPIVENRRLEKAEDIGFILFNNFINTFEIKKKRIDPSSCIDDFWMKRVAKSKEVIANNMIRSDPDWNLNYFLLFMKSQLCTKSEKMFSTAKAGQTLACFAHSVLVRLGPTIRALEKLVRDQLPENIYIHSGKNFDELNEWAEKYIVDDFGIESDYEAFDRSQDEHILAFELELLRFFDVDSSFIEDYKAIKLNLGCKLGNLAIMRFTGEASTFLFNTLCNMAFTACKYDISNKRVMAFAGDDMFISGPCNTINKFNEILDRLSLKAKVQGKFFPMFCGWKMTRYGIIKDPRLVAHRLAEKIEKNEVHLVLNNYALEVSYAYRLGERLSEVFEIEDFEYFYKLVRFFIQRRKDISPEIFARFQSVDGSGQREQVPEEDKERGHSSFECGLFCHLH